MGQHTVEKIGGTSMSKFDLVMRNVIIGDRSGADLYNRIFVVSAYGGITNLLLEHKKTGEPGVYQSFAESDKHWIDKLEDVRTEMCRINAGFADSGLDVTAANDFVRERIDGVRACLKDLRKLCSYGHFQLETHLPVVRELLSSIGEAHSARNSAHILQANGVNARFVDLSGWMSDDNLPFTEKIRTSFEDIDYDTELPIVTGYTKCDEGLMTTFDRGYSEITFSEIAVVTEAREGIIHKEYHLSSGDPLLVGVDKVRTIGHTNYDVADQLADLGMEAIHPRAAKGMERKHIPLRIKNAFEPDHPGTLITQNTYKSPNPRVEMITGCKNILAIEVWDPDMVGQSGYDHTLTSFLTNNRISYIAKNTNANTITHYVPDGRGNLDGCLNDLRSYYPGAEVRTQKVAIVSAIGSNMKVPGFLAKAANALAAADINILACDQCMRQVNMQFIINESQFEAAVKALHNGLIEQESQ